jgi:pyruvate dehydrogenase E2 component (dihydrolipoamide acetyltransferase)
VAAPGGLIVTVVKNAHRMSVLEISKEAGILVEKARAGKLMPDDYTGGTFTVSNLGMFGIENFRPSSIAGSGHSGGKRHKGRGGGCP